MYGTAWGVECVCRLGGRMAASHAGGRLGAVLARVEENVASGNHYEALQQVKGVASRALAGGKYGQAAELLYGSAVRLLQGGMVPAGLELGLRLVECYDKAGLYAGHGEAGAQAAERLTALADLFPRGDVPSTVAGPGRGSAEEVTGESTAATPQDMLAEFLRAAVKWSCRVEDSSSGGDGQEADRNAGNGTSSRRWLGSPNLHDRAARLCLVRGDLSSATRHFVRGSDAEEFAAVMVAEAVKDKYPPEGGDLFCVKAALEFLSVGRREEADTFYQAFSTQYPEAAKGQPGGGKAASERMETPLMHFCKLFIRATQVQPKGEALAVMLRQKYAPALARDPDFESSLDHACHAFFGTPLPARAGPGGILGELLGGLLG